MSSKKSELPLKSLRKVKRVELPDKRSLVAVCDLKPVTMGERVMRYQRTPALKDDLIYHDDKYDPDDFFDDQDRPMSPHEERYQSFLERKKQRKAEIDEQNRLDKLKKQEEERAEFQRRVLEVKETVPVKE